MDLHRVFDKEDGTSWDESDDGAGLQDHRQECGGIEKLDEDIAKSSGHAKDTTTAQTTEDPLDTFMAALNETLKNDEAVKKVRPSEKAFSHSKEEIYESEDTVADMMEAISNYHESKAGAEGAEEGEDEVPKKQRLLLPPVDHNSVAYPEFRKDIYKEHESISDLSISERAAIRAAQKITVTGYKVPHAIASFSQLKQTIQKGLLTNVASQGWNTPTAVQAQFIPVALSGRDIIAIAETGSGKTGAYLISMIQHVCKVLDDWKMISLPGHRGPIGIILCPTRELAAQIYGVAKQLVTGLRLRVSCFSGGYEKTQQFKEIVAGIELCVANPGRLIDLGTMKGGLGFRDTTMLVIDEVDRMLSMGFYPEVMSIWNSIRPDKQLLLLSATFPPVVESLVTALTHRFVKIVIGSEGQAASSVEQRPIVFCDEQKKVNWIVNNIHKLIRWERQVLVFCNSHGRTLDLAAVLNSVLQEAVAAETKPDSLSQSIAGQEWNSDTGEIAAEGAFTDSQVKTPAAARLVTGLSDAVASRLDTLINDSVPDTPIGAVISAAPTITAPQVERIYARHLFGDMNQAERQAVISSFRKKRFPVLVTSDVASRGLDIPNVSTVISYDSALQFDTHIHRIGRTGRASQRGIAYTLLTRKDAKLAGFVVESMQTAGQQVPQQVLQLAMTFEPFRSAQQSGSSYIARMRNHKKRFRADPDQNTGSSLSVPGLGYGVVHETTTGSRFRAMPASATSTLDSAFLPDVDNTKRHPDACEASRNTGLLEGGKSRFSTLRQGHSTLLGVNSHVTHLDGANSTSKKCRVFNANDPISSSSDDDNQCSGSRSQQASCLLKPRNSIRRAANLAAAAAMIQAQSQPPSSAIKPSSSSQHSIRVSRQSRWD